MKLRLVFPTPKTHQSSYYRLRIGARIPTPTRGELKGVIHSHLMDEILLPDCYQYEWGGALNLGRGRGKE